MRQSALWESDQAGRKQLGEKWGPAGACGLVYRHCQWSEGGSVRQLGGRYRDNTKIFTMVFTVQ